MYASQVTGLTGADNQLRSGKLFAQAGFEP
jgi:hypothetical protein